MWCSTCQHDVPAAAGEARHAVCSDCGATLHREDAGSDMADSRPRVAMPQLPDDDWQIEADRRSIERLVAGLRTTRIDSALPLAVPHSVHDAGSPGPAPAPINLAAWSLLSLGLALFSCGAVLLVWSLAADREDLWLIGLPLSLAGQAGLIIGLGLQLEGLWRHSRQNSEALTVLDCELSRVRQSRVLPDALVTAAGRSFSLHAGGNSSASGPAIDLLAKTA